MLEQESIDAGLTHILTPANPARGLERGRRCRVVSRAGDLVRVCLDDGTYRVVFADEIEQADRESAT